MENLYRILEYTIISVASSQAIRQPFTKKMGWCKSWTLDSDGLDYGLEYGLNSRLIFKLLAMVASQGLGVGARNNTGEPTAAAGRPPRQHYYQVLENAA